jgi:pSer/pThr/pTyr-binding forkhead associated (FHA) protein
MFKLVISDDEGKNTVVPFVRDEITIGRKEGNTIRLTERNVSRRHARLRRNGERLVVEDLGSYNGVNVNGARIAAETELRAGDQVGIGDYLLAVQTEGIEVASDAGLAPGQEIAASRTSMVPVPVPPPRLVMLFPPPGGAEFALTKNSVRIGRAEHLDVVIQHRSMSREHAEVVRDGDSFTIRDLGSANGVRVNGKEVERARLKPADVIELGQVRLTYIGLGEDFIYDPSMSESNLESDAHASRRALYAGLALIALAAVAAFFIFTKLTGETPVAETQGTPPQTPEAVAPAAAAVVEAPAAPEPVSPELATFERGLESLRSGNLESAYFDFDSLPTESPYRERAEVRDATLRYARVLLTQANDLATRNAAEAQRLAGVVLAMVGLSPELVEEARRIEARTRGSKRAPASTTAAANPNTGEPATAAPSSRLAEALACAQGGDSACVIRILSGQARTEGEYSLLIDTLRLTPGREREARRWMEQFVTRFPSAPRTREYRRLLPQAPECTNPYGCE